MGLPRWKQVAVFQVLHAYLDNKAFFALRLTSKGFALRTRRWRKILYGRRIEKRRLAVVNQRGREIRWVDNPSVELQVAAVNQNGKAICYIKDPHLDAQLAAVNQNGKAICYIKDPCLEVQLAAVNQDRRAIKDIKNPRLEVQLAAKRPLDLCNEPEREPKLKKRRISK